MSQLRSRRGLRRATAALAAALLLASAWPALAGDAPAGPEVHVATGTLEGLREDAHGVGLRVFRGIPYAAAPTGRLRWRAPQPAAAWQGVRKAQRFGPRCMQRGLFGDMVFRSDGMSEDCLYLNVWTPAQASGAKLPVLVYFYGGGFVGGDGSEPRYDGAGLAAKGIVTVTVNYRLDVFGFLALPALADESPHHAAGNYGLLDQAAALRWVHDNIAAFGGDPGAITIGGESAGSMSVSALMASPLSRGLLRRAIGESGAVLGNLAPPSLAAAEKQGEAFAKHVGAHSLAQLRAMPAATLLEACGDKGVAEFGPDVDGWFLPRPPEAIYQAGEQAHVPLLVGSNSQEGYYAYLLQDAAPTPDAYRAVVRKQFGAHADEALRLYPGATGAEVKASGTALSGDMFIAFSTWRWMDLQRRTGDAPVYYYYFTQPRPASRDGRQPAGTGAVHSGEIEYALGNLAGNRVYAWTDEDRAVSATLQDYFAAFIKTGDPNAAGLPHWPAAAPADGGLWRQEIGPHTHTFVDRNAPRYGFLQRALPPEAQP
ncbi:carboxylesterase family protein [Fulvimonas sp. R45]|uniref:carboxylesterase/lipase family protein n=1 Tax=Fulvimonas sp. R45 TaxID=3045937 RepID=UPI00265F67BF|nr:carboxylesterase family protein [Fulvimonas sp. R45]MDO1529562.1 carboxylesterase family protein [Fulvimonas sp. R45]